MSADYEAQIINGLATQFRALAPGKYEVQLWGLDLAAEPPAPGRYVVGVTASDIDIFAKKGIGSFRAYAEIYTRANDDADIAGIQSELRDDLRSALRGLMQVSREGQAGERLLTHKPDVTVEPQYHAQQRLLGIEAEIIFAY